MYIFKNRYIYIYTVFVNMCANMFLNIHVNILYVSFTYVHVYKVNWLWGGWVKPTKSKVVLQSKLIVGWLGRTHKFKVVYFWYIGGFDDEGGDDDDDCHGDGDDDGDDVYDDDGDKYGDDDDEDEDDDEFQWGGHGRFVGFPHWRYHNHKWNRCKSKSSAANFTRRHHQQTNIDPKNTPLGNAVTEASLWGPNYCRGHAAPVLNLFGLCKHSAYVNIQILPCFIKVNHWSNVRLWAVQLLKRSGLLFGEDFVREKLRKLFAI